MKKQSDRQLELDLGPVEGEEEHRSKRRRFPDMSRPLATGRKKSARQDAPLLRTPMLTKCGFCGHEMTVLEEVAICPSCGSVVVRPDEDG